MLAFYLAFSLPLYLARILAFYLVYVRGILWHSIWIWQEETGTLSRICTGILSGIPSDISTAGSGLGVPTELWRSWFRWSSGAGRRQRRRKKEAEVTTIELESNNLHLAGGERHNPTSPEATGSKPYPNRRTGYNRNHIQKTWPQNSQPKWSGVIC